MAGLTGKVKNVIKKGKSIYGNMTNPWWQAKHKYIEFYEQCAIDDHIILLESQQGSEMSGNIFYLLRYLVNSKKYDNYAIYLSVRAAKKKLFREKLDSYGMQKVRLTELSSEEYFRLMASAKYLFNDNTFLPFFMKKEGQIYVNTWHGTPLKSLGRRIKNDAYAIGNAQKNFVAADYLLFPNEHTRDAIIDDYMVANISQGSSIMGGYPRNEVFFDDARRDQLRKELGLEGKRVYAYMPTFRGTARTGGTSKNTSYMHYYLFELDKKLKDDEVFYLNLHPVAKKDVDFSEFQHIQNFPAGYETYDVLNTADVLITDYSSVFFDFACTRRKIVLFAYDKEDYFRDRGVYLSLDELPFPQAMNDVELLEELRRDKNYDDTAFLERFCKYENANASQMLCDQTILGEDCGMEVIPVPNNGKENVLLYAGNLAGNGITASLRSLLNSIDLEKRNYYFTFYTDYVGKNKDNIFTFPEGANFFAMAGFPNLTLSDLPVRKAFQTKKMSANRYMKLQGKRVKEAFDRTFGGAHFDQVIQFSGYEPDTIFNFGSFDGPRTIYVHSDMQNEMKTRGNQRRDVLRYAYTHYDHVAVVTEDVLESTAQISGKRDNITVARNLIDYPTILAKSELDIALDPVTKSNVTEERLKEILASDAEVFINVGRFSPEKGHDRLVSAFNTYHKTHSNSYLLIMGGSSMNQGYDKLMAQVASLGIQNSVILLENVSNPYPIVKACDYFILSSHYEGFGLVLVEADILGLKVISTDIPGPRTFMQRNGGVMVESSEAGILTGMHMLHDGQVEKLSVDYAQYNREAVAEFESILEAGR